jgi:AraC family transcriptional regulator of adaptative response / DNA-3-methyladenine glycosylase II
MRPAPDGAAVVGPEFIRAGGTISRVPVDVALDEDACRRAVAVRDQRFDGWFVVGTAAAGVYCRPSCPAAPRDGAIFRTTAAARAGGLRCCRRCLPDAAPGSPEWDLRTDLAARAMRLINDGVVDRHGVAGLASRLGCPAQRLAAVLTVELGAGPLELAATRRAQVARLLLASTDLAPSEVAFAAGFDSPRRLDDALLAAFGLPVKALAGRSACSGASDPAATGSGTGGPGATGTGVWPPGGPPRQPVPVALRLPVRPPLDAAGLLSFLVRRAVPGVEQGDGDGYARTLALPHGPGTVSLGITGDGVDALLRLTDLRDVGAALNRVRRLTGADAAPAAVDEVLAADPALAPAVRATPGIRMPGAVDGPELVLRALLGQQVSVAAARTAAGRLAAALGTELPAALSPGPLAAGDLRHDVTLPRSIRGNVTSSRTREADALSRLFPTPAQVAERGAEVLGGPRRRVAAILGAAAAMASGDLRVHAGRDLAELSRELQALPGIGPWTAGYVAMRVLGATDVLLSTDLMVRRGAQALGLPDAAPALEAHSARWRPWRSYAAMHLWRASARLATM